MKKILIVIGVLVLGAGVWLGVRGGEKSSTASTPAVARKKTGSSATVERRTVEVTVDAVGEISPVNLVTVKPEVSGRIRTLHVVTGQDVNKGELLVSLDDTELLTEREAALTDIAGAQVQLQKAERDFERNNELFSGKLVSQEAFENAKTTLELARNDFEKAQKRLQSVEDKLQKISMRAPFDGTVLSVFVSNGQVVSGATGVSQGTDLMTFADLNQMYIRAHINQVDVTKVEPGQRAAITVDSLAGTPLEGKVTLIAPIATVKNNIKGFSVDVLITSSDPRIRPGMNANLKFPVMRVENALTVPIVAVFADGKDKVVYVRSGRGVERRPVSVGVSDYNFCEIVNGVGEGEVVLLERPPQSKSS